MQLNALASALPTRIILHRQMQEQEAAAPAPFGVRARRETLRDLLALRSLYRDRTREFRVGIAFASPFSGHAMLLTI